jgi:uncharacterized membrane protein
MTENPDRINQLLAKLETLLEKQEMFSREINELRGEINKLKSSEIKYPFEAIQEKDGKEFVPEPVSENVKETLTTNSQILQKTIPQERSSEPSRIKKDLEKFIGENLINKIGIAITIIGVAIGAKYSIEHQLISPLTRIILGYIMGLGLLGIGLRLKNKYENFSAVLVSGAMAIMYLITYFAYTFYALIPQNVAFVIMVIFTAFTVYAALKYNKQIIAHIGLVGAYTVPFLISDSSGNVVILFSYTAMINIGILVIAFNKYWKSLYYSSFLLTWLIYFSWFLSGYESTQHYAIALTFLIIFFVIFYSMFLANKLLKKEKFDIGDILLILSNSFIFYGLGYSIINDQEGGKHFLGLYTFCNAVIHFTVSTIIYKQKQADRNLFYFVFGLVLTFITIAIPVQLNGNWVTLLWTGEAALLFWIGRTKNIKAYEILSYPLMLLAFFSIMQDYGEVYLNFKEGLLATEITPFFNVTFLTSLLFIASFGFIYYINTNEKYTSPLVTKNDLLKIISFVIPAILLYVIYCAPRLEIAAYWNQLYADSKITVTLELDQHYFNSDLLKFKSIWLINYSLAFFTILSFVNIKKLKNQNLAFINLAFNALVILIFLIQGLYVISDLRESYLHQSLSQYYQRGFFNIGIRYISMIFVGFLLYSTYRYIRQDFIKINFSMAFDLMLHISIVWIASSELISWMDIAGSTQSYKLGLSILWGVYSLFLISLGIWKRKKYLRIAAIALFSITLLKLFFYDISRLDTISKTIVFVSLGLLLLTISFLYNKYKNIISEEIKPKSD